MHPLHVRGMGGFGDNIYQRPLIRYLCEAHDVYLSTPYLELYADLPVRPVMWPAGPGFRCQRKAISRHPRETWHAVDRRWRRARLWYPANVHRQVGSLFEDLEAAAGVRVDPFVFDLPDFGPPPIEPPYAVIRPASIRKEWLNSARNPDPAYLEIAARELRSAGLQVVCVADIEPPGERLVGRMPEADVYMVNGELPPSELLALTQHAAVVVGGVGWIVPACLAQGTPAIIIGGGLGQWNHPRMVVDRRMDDSRMRFLLPAPYCECRKSRHDCPKEIPDFDPRFAGALDDLLAVQAAA